MKEASAKEVRAILEKKWPELKQIWLFDRKYMLITVIEVEQILSSLNDMPRFRYELFDCDDFALVTHAFVKQKFAGENKYKYNAAFGEVMFYEPVGGIHVANLFITEDETIWFYDAQLKQMETPLIPLHDVYFVRM